LFLFFIQKVIGNVSNDKDKGNIELSLVPNHPNNRLDGQEVPIKLERGSKRLILIRQLDKEGIEGENGVVIGIKCKKKYSNDPSIIIPVRIIVTDANDHSPQFIGTPYVINVSEVTVVGSTLIPNSKIKAIDEDQQGPFSTVEYYIEPGPFSHLLKFESRLGGNIILTSALDFETLPKFWVVIRAQDQGEPPNTATTTLSVNVQDADDQNPRFLDDKYSSVLPDVYKENQVLSIKPKAIRAIDPDKQINSPIQYLFNSPDSSREYSYFSIDPKFGTIKLKRPLPVNLNLPITLVIKAVQTDNRDRYALTTLTIISNKQSELTEIRFLKSNYTASVFESVPIGHTLLTVQTTRPSDDNYKLSSPSVTSSLSTSSSSSFKSYSTKYQILDDDENYFGIRNNGDIIVKKPLDYETKQWHSFRVMASDGKQSDVTRVYISLINVNDHNPQFSQVHYNFWVNDDNRHRSKAFVGQIKATDNDVDDKLSFTIKGPFANVFSINSQGLLKIKNLTGLNTTQCHLIVVATDNGSPPRSSSVPVTVQFSPSALRNLGRSFESESESFFNDLESDSSELYSSGVNINSIFNASGSSAVILVIVLGALLATLFIIIITLTVNVLKQRKFFDSSSGLSSSSSTNDSSSSSTTDVSPHSNHTISKLTITPFKKKNKIGVIADNDKSLYDNNISSHGVENPIFSVPNTVTSNLSSRYYTSPINGSSNRSDPDSAIASDASSNETITISSSNRKMDVKGNNDNQERSLSPPPPPPSITCVSSSSPDKMMNNLTNTDILRRGTTSKISVLKWPQGSIPRRIKKLTWEDEKFGHNSVVNYSSVIKTKLGQSEKIDNVSKSFNHNTNHGLSSSSDDHSTNYETHIELDPNVSVAPFPRTFHHQDNSNSNLPDLTVYF